MAVFIGATRSQFIQDIKDDILKGEQFGNEAANWFTLFRVKDKMFVIYIRDKKYYYKNVDSAAKRVAQLIRGR